MICQWKRNCLTKFSSISQHYVDTSQTTNLERLTSVRHRFICLILQFYETQHFRLKKTNILTVSQKNTFQLYVFGEWEILLLRLVILQNISNHVIIFYALELYLNWRNEMWCPLCSSCNPRHGNVHYSLLLLPPNETLWPHVSKELSTRPLTLVCWLWHCPMLAVVIREQ